MDKVDVKLLEQELKNCIAHFKTTISGIIPGQTGMLESIQIDAYGQRLPLKELALIGNLNSHEIEIKPYDKQLLKEMEFAISQKELGTVRNTGSGLIFIMPPLTMDLYTKLQKSMKEHFDATGNTIRNIRRKSLDTIEEIKKNKDAYRKQEEIVQKYIDQYNNEAKKIFTEISGKLK